MAYINPAEFVRQVRQEAARVTWPTRKETGISVIMVCVMVAVASVFFLLVDGGISQGIEWLLGI